MGLLKTTPQGLYCFLFIYFSSEALNKCALIKYLTNTQEGEPRTLPFSNVPAQGTLLGKEFLRIGIQGTHFGNSSSSCPSRYSGELGPRSLTNPRIQPAIVSSPPHQGFLGPLCLGLSADALSDSAPGESILSPQSMAWLFSCFCTELEPLFWFNCIF